MAKIKTSQFRPHHLNYKVPSRDHKVEAVLKALQAPSMLHREADNTLHLMPQGKTQVLILQHIYQAATITRTRASKSRSQLLGRAATVHQSSKVTLRNVTMVRAQARVNGDNKQLPKRNNLRSLAEVEARAAQGGVVISVAPRCVRPLSAS